MKYNVINMFTRLAELSFPAAFTIEASVILPIAFVIIVWFISVSFTIHDKVVSFSATVYNIIQSRPSDTVNGADGKNSELINMGNLDGRKVLLKYKLLQDGLHSLTGGLEDED